MSGFFYFVPISRQHLIVDDRLQLSALGSPLSAVLADVCDVPGDCIVTEISAGPDGNAGCVLIPLSPGVEVPRVPGYVPDAQTWHKADHYWIGFEGDVPRPEAFARKTQVLGYVVPDKHGRSWHVPLIRGLDRPYGALPCDYEFGEDFVPSEVLQRQYRSLWADSARMWDAYDEQAGGVATTFTAQFAARCLQVNYRVGPAELNLLAEHGVPVFDRQDVTQRFAGSAVDAPAVLEFIEQKKTIPSLPVPGGTTSTAGTQAETNTGDPPVASCE